MQPNRASPSWTPPFGTGGFLLAAHEYISRHYAAGMDAEEERFLKLQALRGIEIVDAAARFCAMNLFCIASAATKARSKSQTASQAEPQATTIWC
jgi:type I restriction enzyme M protein